MVNEKKTDDDIEKLKRELKKAEIMALVTPYPDALAEYRKLKQLVERLEARKQREAKRKAAVGEAVVEVAAFTDAYEIPEGAQE